MSWWKLEISDDIELNDIDLEHISNCILEGYTSGEICQEEDEDDE